jgi:predicted  nucleic acid-binding Zn-ribbon protein
MSEDKAPNPVEVLQQNIQSAQYKINDLQNGVRLTSVRDDLEDIDAKIKQLPGVVLEVRTKGYLFEKSLEGKIEALSPQWTSVRPGIVTRINQLTLQLETEVRKIDPIMQELTSRSRNPGAASSYLSQVNSAVETMESKVSSAENSLRGMYDSINSEVENLENHCRQLIEMLDQFASAGFHLLATEAPVQAVKAVWAVNGKEDNDDPEGYLFLTDQRIIFEQNEEIATKKFLFITTESEKVQKVLFEFPVALVKDVTASKQGLFKNEDHLDILCEVGAPYQKVHLHLDGQDCNEWDATIGRVKTKDFDKDRLVPVDKAVEEKVKNAPAKCPTCGGAITKPVLRGQDTITCDFCGSVIKL